MKKLLLNSILLLCALIVGSTSLWAATTTYQHVFTAKPSTGSNISLSSVNWDIAATELGSYNSANYAGVQIGTSKKDGSITLTSSSAWGSETGTYKDKTKITEVRLWLNLGGTSVTPTVTIGGKSATSDGTTVVKNSSAGSDWTKATKVTFTPASNGNSGVVVINVSSVKAGYICCMEIDCEEAGSASAPSITVDPNSINAPSEDTDGTIDVTYNNITSVDAEVFFCESDGTTPADYSSWLDAEIDNNNDVYYVIGENTGDVRTAYMKVHQKNTEVYSELITITQSAPVVVTLDFTSNEWGISASPTKTVDATVFTRNGYSITLEGSAGNGYYFDTNNIMLGKSGATLTLPAFGFNVNKIKVYGVASGASKDVTFNVFVGDDAVSTAATSSQVAHEFAIAAEKQDVGTIYVIKVTNAYNMRISKIEVFGNGCEAGLVQSYGWATYIPTANVEYPANTAYIVTDASVSSGLTLEEVTEVPANTPILLKGAGAKTAIALDAAPSALSSNLLEVSNGTDLASGYYPYVLAKNGESACFKQWTGAMSSLDGRVMLVLDEAAAARAVFELEDETTGVENIKRETITNNQYFNLAGQRVAQPTKGLYIVNGKTVVIK